MRINDASRLQIWHLAYKTGVSLSNMQFSIYKQASRLTNWRLRLQLSEFSLTTCEKSKIDIEKSLIFWYNKQCHTVALISNGMDEDKNMIISYDNLWKLLIDKRMNKTELAQKTKISTSTIAKMSRGEPVALTVLVRICDYLNCDIGDVVSVKRV